jgi:predicted Zn finger-like uncharacterized protein
MPQTWKTAEADQFYCPHCQALYAVTVNRLPTKDHDRAHCEVCKKVMNEWNSTISPSYRLIERNDDPTA